METASPASSDVAPPDASDRPSLLRRNRGKLILFAVLAVPAGILAAYTWLTLSFAYSSGERVGFVQKLSTKGWICKTWEGELAMTTMPGAAPEIFAFSIRDDVVAAKVNAVQGKRVALSYKQHKGVPSKCFGETQYFVTDVRAVNF